jgi:hypothetical protein
MKAVPDRRDQILSAAIVAWGNASQIDMAIEEMAELTKALLKLRRAEGNESKYQRALDDVHDEMADVRIMMRQLEIIFGEPDNEEFAKLCRLADRLQAAGHDPWVSEATP